jgi:putative intracellular protease/amidase
MNILIVLTSHDALGTTGYPTGFSFEDFTAAYYAFLDAGADLTLASPMGGPPPVDPSSRTVRTLNPCIERFRSDTVARTLLSDTLRLEQIDIRDFDGAYFPNGRGALWDLASDAHCRSVVAGLLTAGKPVAFVGHAAAALLEALDDAGRPLVLGRSLTCFPNSEESAAGLTSTSPRSLQEELIQRGARYSKAQDGTAHVVQDGELITGQNPASALEAALRLLDRLRR